MAPKVFIPNGFTAINDAKDAGAVVSLMGVIVSVKEPRKTKGTDWSFEFAIQDDFTTGAVGNDACINCRIFRRSPTEFPKALVGDVALLRDFQLHGWSLRVDAISKLQLRSGVLVFPATGIPVPELSQAFQTGNEKLKHSAMFGTKAPTTHEQMAAIHLKHAASGSLQQVKQHAATAPVQPAAADRSALIKDLDYNRFYDIRAQVVNTYYNNLGTFELKVTDYTTNKDLFLYVDPDDEDYAFQAHSWMGPYGQYTINVLLYGNNAGWARENVAIGDYVFLRNMHTKMSQLNKLEGVLHEDRQRPNQIDIRKLMNQKDIKEIDERRKKYDEMRSKKSAFAELQNEYKKPSAKLAAQKKAEKKARQRNLIEQEQKEIAEQAEKWDAARSGVNTNVLAAYPEVQSSTISEIIHNPRLKSQTPKSNDFTLPFLNCRHRSRVRVIDFFPPELELFAHCTSDPSWDKRARKPDPNDSNSKLKWEWGFALLLEDAKIPPNTVSEKLRVVVPNDAAQYLLDLNARDLKRDPRTLKKLEEKLFILWGNLFELKTELRDQGRDLPLPPGDNRLQNKPFDCCIEEYGHEVHVSEKHPEGYQRMHKLAHTKITD